MCNFLNWNDTIRGNSVVFNSMTKHLLENYILFNKIHQNNWTHGVYIRPDKNVCFSGAAGDIFKTIRLDYIHRTGRILMYETFLHTPRQIHVNIHLSKSMKIGWSVNITPTSEWE